MSHHIHARRLLLLLLVALVVGGLAAVSVSWAQTPTSVTLKVKGASTRRLAHFCHKTKRLRVFRSGATLEYKGLVAPAPPKHFPVTVKVERCQHGRFARIAKYQFQGKRASGRFKAFFRAPGRRGRISYFSAIANVGGRDSNKRYFAVRR